ncbi:unnamed protein product [Parajaminaea phylloscopi]
MTDFGATLTYDNTTLIWPSEGSVDVRHWGTAEQVLLLQVSVEWLRIGGVSTYAYIAEQCRGAYEEDGVLLRSDGSHIADHDTVSAGVVFLDTGTTARPHPRYGPRFKYKYRPMPDTDSASTMSDSKRSTARQSSFRWEVVARDSVCLISDVNFRDCTAAHILPQSRPEYYAEVLGPQANTSHLFRPSYGLLLSDILHHAFDRGQIAFYPKGEDLIVHIFYATTFTTARYHGKVLTPDRFRCQPYERPSIPLLLFHYRQCAMKHLRGFDWRSPPPA